MGDPDGLNVPVRRGDRWVCVPIGDMDDEELVKVAGVLTRDAFAMSVNKDTRHATWALSWAVDELIKRFVSAKGPTKRT